MGKCEHCDCNFLKQSKDRPLFCHSCELREETLSKVRLDGMRAGATGILGAVLNMCNEGKGMADIKSFCEKSLNLDGMKED